MGEGGIDDVRVIHSVDQLVNADAGQQSFFAQQPVVGGAVELQQVVEIAGAFREPRQNGAALAVLGGNETVCVA